MTTPNISSITVTLSPSFSLTKFLSENKRGLLIGFSVSLITYGLGMISGAYMQNAITQAGLASCPAPEGTNFSDSWTTSLLRE